MTDSPLQEFDSDAGLITPTPPDLTEPLPALVVLCYFPEIVDGLAETHGARRIGRFSAETGSGPIFAVEHGVQRIAVTHPGMGAPLAAHHLEQLIAAGGTTFMVCGGAGAVRPDLALGHIVVPTGAIRDEGTSYHYAAPSRSIAVDPACVERLTELLDGLALPHVSGLVWTTDASFRETPQRIRRRRDEGCLVVEMEAAALLAVAAYRSVRLAYCLYAGDDISGDEWHHRGWNVTDRRRVLLDFAVEAAGKLAPPHEVLGVPDSASSDSRGDDPASAG